MATTTPEREEPARTPSLPVDADAARIFRAFQEAHDAVEPTLWSLSDLDKYDGQEPGLEPVTDEKLAALATIQSDLDVLLDELTGFRARLAAGIRVAVAICAEQKLHRVAA